MAYATPRTWVAGAVLTAAQLNQDVRDNVSFLANPPACRVYHNTTQSIANSTFVALAFNSERYDTDAMHSTATLTSRITLNTAGVYLLTATVEFAGDNDYTDLIVKFVLNGTTDIAYTRDFNPGPAGSIRVYSLATAYKFAAGNYVEILVWQTNTSAGANNVNSVGNRSPEFSATWIGLG